MSDEDEEPGYELVVPFIACTSQGGPYQDDAFVAGFALGTIDSELAHGHPVSYDHVSPALVPQLDLIAMRRGYIVTSEPWPEDPAAWTRVTFTVVDHDADLEAGLG